VSCARTVLPGTTQEVIIPILEAASGKKAGRDFGVCFNPEFLREGSSIKDFHNPPYTIVGTEDERVAQAMARLYSFINARLEVVPIRVAEMIKYANNAFHALKVTFANEIGAICKQGGIDSHQVMELVCLDTKLNLSPYYLKPGFAFGGSCLPKDLRALLHYSHHRDLSLPLLEAILPSNNRQIDVAYDMISRAGSKRVGVLGLSFKAGTDDLRESPIVDLIERLIGKGYQVKVYDKNVSLSNLHGANRVYIEQQIPHIAGLMADTVEEVLETSDLIVVGNNSPEFAGALPLLRPEHMLIDLVRITDDYASLNGQYHGIGW
jgi:GDP-mannose 6-dehydrogenase